MREPRLRRTRSCTTPRHSRSFRDGRAQGVCSIKWPTVDMPFSERGLVPDVIINPNAFPSRMTIGMLVESMAAKAGALHAVCQDATPFRYGPGSQQVRWRFSHADQPPQVCLPRWRRATPGSTRSIAQWTSLASSSSKLATTTTATNPCTAASPAPSSTLTSTLACVLAPSPTMVPSCRHANTRD